MNEESVHIAYPSNVSFPIQFITVLDNSIRFFRGKGLTQEEIISAMEYALRSAKRLTNNHRLSHSLPIEYGSTLKPK